MSGDTARRAKVRVFRIVEGCEHLAQHAEAHAFCRFVPHHRFFRAEHAVMRHQFLAPHDEALGLGACGGGWWRFVLGECGPDLVEVEGGIEAPRRRMRREDQMCEILRHKTTEAGSIKRLGIGAVEDVIQRSLQSWQAPQRWACFCNPAHAATKAGNDWP